MASAFFLTTIVIVVLTFVNSERPFLHYPTYLEKALPRHWEHDKEKLIRNVEQDARGSQVGARPRLSPLYNPERAAHADESLKRVRVDLLKSKLMPHLPQRNVVAHGKPVPKPDNEPHQRHKREVEQTLPEEEGKGTIREKRTVMINQPEMVMQPHIQPALTHDKEIKYQEKVTEKRDKRQIIYLINQRPLLFAKKPRKTTPNPFDREADIADYEIMRPTPEGLIPAAVETDEDIDTGSYLLNEEASEFSRIISDFYLTTSDEFWPEIRQFAEVVLKPLSELLEKNFGTNKEKIKTEEDKNSDQIKTQKHSRKENRERMPSIRSSFKELVNRRVKRRVEERGKTLWRKQAKKRKQKQRRVERKRLRMLTHARRVRKQQKSKKARLERHYARMNLTTTVPDHLRDQRVINKTVRSGKDENIDDDDDNKDSYKETAENDSDVDSEYSEEKGDSEENNSYEDTDTDGSPDDGNDDYEYEDDDDDDNSDDDSNNYVDYENVEDDSGKTKNKNNGNNDKNKQNSKPNHIKTRAKPYSYNRIRH